VEADRGRADDYYLAEGTGIAERYVASPEGVRAGEPLTGDGYESWVAGYDPATGAAKGRLRTDDQGVRFVEVVVNGPKTWSLASALHSDIANAYDVAQDRAAEQVIGWLAEHATTRVGPRGRQVQVPVQELEAATVRHYTSRAGDPHRHLHLQVNARVFAEGTWRGLHTVGVRDSLDALNGIGHAAVITDPGFRGALAAHGYTVDDDSGEVVELAGFTGAFSARAAQIGRNMDRYEAAWRAANPGAEPAAKLRRSWDARAWAEARPDKVIPRDGAELSQHWVDELYGLGYRDPDVQPPGSRLASVPAWSRVGQLDREGAVGTVLTRLGARRSAWNAADVRGEVEQLIARTGLVAEAAARLELAEDLTARALTRCVPLLAGSDGSARSVPEHIRALTSPQVLAVEDDLTSRLVARAGTQAAPAGLVAAVDAAERLDAAQQAVAAGLADTSALLVVEGAAGAGKTTTLAATREALERQRRRLVVVTPTLKAARVAAAESGTTAYSAAWLAHQHGYRWDTHGAWTRLHAGQADPDTGALYAGPRSQAVLGSGDLLLVDEAGMLDQDTARALLVIADERRARLALVGDRHQLPAVGRGGVLDLAARWATPESCLVLDTVHRFTDPEFARLSLAMRTGEHPDQVFDALLARDQIRIHPRETERSQALAEIATGQRCGEPSGEAGGRDRVLVIADTRELVAAINATVRDRLVAAGQVEDTRAMTTSAGERIGVGDRVATRRNDRDLDVANRDTWSVAGIDPDGTLTLTDGHGGGGRGERRLPAGYVREHLELAYATTVYGAQGQTVSSAHLLVGEHTGAAAAYVGMTRGRDTNIAHLVAKSVEDARNQWVGTFGRDRADLGPAHAARLAAQEAGTYAPHRPLERALADLRQAWTREADLTDQLALNEHLRDQLAPIVAIRAEADSELTQLAHTETQPWRAADQAHDRLDRAEAILSTDAARLADALRRRWDAGYLPASHAAEIIRNGRGRLGGRRAQLRDARTHLSEWAQTWQPILPGLPTEPDPLARQMPYTGTSVLHQAITRYAEQAAEHAHPDQQALRDAAKAAARHADDASTDRTEAQRAHSQRLTGLGSVAQTSDPAGRLAETERDITELTEQLRHAHDRLAALRREPAIRTLPPGRLETERETWAHDHDHAQAESAALAALTAPPLSGAGVRHEQLTRSGPDRGDPGRGIPR